MSETMMRINVDVVSKIKLLKGYLGTKDSHQEIVDKVVTAELLKTHADTDDGYLPIGTVVMGPMDKPIIIRDISCGNVVFECGTSLINSSSACRRLKYLSCNVESYEGGAFHE